MLMALLTCTVTAWSQTEMDDLYYTAKDRQRDLDARPKVNRNISRFEETAEDVFGDSDSGVSKRRNTLNQEFDGNYAGRSMNPDFDPLSEEGQNGDFNYFSSTYAPIGVNNRLYDRYYDPRFPSNNFYNTWNNPYSAWGHNRFYDPFYSPYGFNGFGFDPFIGGGCFSCYSSGWGFGVGNSWSMFNYGFNNFGWNNPYMGFGYGFGYSSWNRPNTIIINQYDRYPRVVYGKRPSRSINYNNDARQNVRTRQMVVSGEGSRSSQSSRVASERNTNYYQRGWRQDPSINTRTVSPANKSTARTSMWNLAPSSDWSNNNSNRNSSGFGSGSGNRSSGFSGGGFSSGGSSSGARRGRN